MAGRINKLDQQLANQIAAGEVVERPANAAKELVENALDAGARRIVIEIEEGGKKLIRVRDDGIGMNSSDAVLSLQRHATSKLHELDDLHQIQTLGFRGEALPSIASVSRLEMITREADSEAGTRLIVEGGVVLEAGEVGCAPGTEISIHNLFYNTPARFKFLKSDQAEAARISEIVGHLALAYPEVAFQLRHNGNENLRVEAGGNAFNALVCVLGKDVARQMLPISLPAEPESGVRVTGFVGRPQLTRANRNGQIFFVNGRVIKHRSLQHALAAAYQGLLHGHDRFPLAVIFINLPPNAVDVNVHPTKSEVRFAREWEIHHAVRVAARDTLAAAQLAPEWGFNGHSATVSSDQVAAEAAPYPPPGEAAPVGSLPPTSPAPADWRGFSRPVAPGGGNLEAFRTTREMVWNGQHSLPDLAPPAPPTAEDKLSLRPLAQISNNAYILCEAPDGLYIVCQHRAHERILADKAMAAAEGRPVESQRLVIPFTVEAGPRALAAVEENADLLKDLGFDIESFGGNALLVRAVPAQVAKGDYEGAFGDLLDELVAGTGAGRGLADKRRKLLTMLSCKNAIKAGDPLQPAQMQGLIDDLVQLPNPGICPHGQPILIKISTLELDKKFEREYAMR